MIKTFKMFASSSYLFQSLPDTDARADSLFLFVHDSSPGQERKKLILAVLSLINGFFVGRVQDKHSNTGLRSWLLIQSFHTIRETQLFYGIPTAHQNNSSGEVAAIKCSC